MEDLKNLKMSLERKIIEASNVVIVPHNGIDFDAIASAFAIALIAAMTVGGEYLMLMGAFLPIIIAASAIFSCVLVSLLMNFDKTCNLFKNLFISIAKRYHNIP